MNLSHPSARMIIAYCRAKGVSLTQTAYILGTAWHETARFRYMREIWGPTPAQKRYEGRKDLGNTERGDGKRFMGRGFVEITGRRNYADWSKRLGMDLIANPALAEKPETAVKILVDGMMGGTFTGKSLPAYVNEKRTDYLNARRVVNGTDRAQMIAGHAVEYEAALKAMGYGEEKPVEPVKPSPAPSPEAEGQEQPAAKPEPKRGILAIIFEIIGKLLKGGK